MAVRYKVWIHIEKIDEDNNMYEDLEGLDIPQSVGEYETYSEALALVDYMCAVCTDPQDFIDRGLPEK